jgi:hypothetical protein
MPPEIAPSSLCSPDPRSLHELRDEECNLVIWQRRLEQDFYAVLAPEARNIRLDSDLQSLDESLTQALAANRFSGKSLHGALVSDIAHLARCFCEALRLDRFEVRLEIVTTDSCRKFHADYVSARLITTYVGPGTEWLDAEDARRVAEGAQPRQINRLDTGDVGIFKGKLATLSPAIHRSPPIAGTGEQRLLLVLNPVTSSQRPHAK